MGCLVWLVALVSVVSAVPTLLGADTMDVDTNGKVDHIRLNFNEPMLDSSFYWSDWSVSGMQVMSVATRYFRLEPLATNDTRMYIRVAEGAEPNTDATPAVSYTVNNTMSVGLEALAAINGMISNDKSAPIVVLAEGAPGLRIVRITMSEPVVSTRADGGFNTSDFLYTNSPRNGTVMDVLPAVPIDQGAVQFIASGTDFNGSDSVLEFNADHSLEEPDFGADTVSSKFALVLDKSGNSAAFRRLALSRNTNLVQSEASSPLNSGTVALGVVFMVLVLAFIVGSFAWWWSKRGDSPSMVVTDDGGSGGSVPGSSGKGAQRKGSIPIGSPEVGSDVPLHNMSSQEVLAKYDANHDGVIDKQELAEIVKDAQLIKGGGVSSDGMTSPPVVPRTATVIAAEKSHQMLKDDDDDDDAPKRQQHDDVNDIKFDL